MSIRRAAAGAARRALERSPAVHCGVARLRRGRNRQIVDRRTDLLVESFPRAGNTFLVAALRVATPDLVVASHLHHPNHLRRAGALGVPSLTVLRRPLDSCTSLAIYDDRPPSEALLARWLAFHRVVVELPAVTVVRFEDVVGDIAAVVTFARSLVARRVPDPRPGDLGDLGDLDARAAAEVEAMTLRRFGAVDAMRVSRPEAQRERSKAEVRAAFGQLDAGLLGACEAAYERLLARAVVLDPPT